MLMRALFLLILPGLWIASATALSADQSQGGGHGDRAEIAALQRSVDAGFKKLRSDFLFDEDSDETVQASPFARAVAQWNRGLARCADDPCRIAALRAQLARLDFANGKPVGPLPGAPWRTGAFDLHGKGIAGSLTILPVGDGTIVTSITTFGTSKRAWDCAYFIATGAISPMGRARMTVSEDDDAEDGTPPGAFILTATSPTVATLTSASPDGADTVCATGSILGTYRAVR